MQTPRAIFFEGSNPGRMASFSSHFNTFAPPVFFMLSSPKKVEFPGTASRLRCPAPFAAGFLGPDRPDLSGLPPDPPAAALLPRWIVDHPSIELVGQSSEV